MTNKILCSLFWVIIAGCAYSKSKDIPEFRLPPPQPSATDDIAPSYFSNCKTLSDVNTKLTSALDKCGYVRKSFFYVPNGFALVTQLEKINEDGSVKPEGERWRLDNYRGEFSLKNYFRNLFNANPGFYRCIVFVITDSYYKYSENLATQGQAREWLISGVNKLPPEIGQIKTSPNYSYNVLIYQFKKNENDSATNIIIPSPITGRTHLIKSKIYEQLK
jgi:hypothetical protein